MIDFRWLAKTRAVTADGSASYVESRTLQYRERYIVEMPSGPCEVVPEWKDVPTIIEPVSDAASSEEKK